MNNKCRNNNNMSVTPNKLKEIANAKGIMAKDLAKSVGTTKETVSRHMNHRVDISYEMALKYGQVLNVAPEMIIFQPQGIEALGTTQPDNSIKMFAAEDGRKTVTAPFNFPPNTSAVLGGNDSVSKFWTDGTLYVFDKTAMRQRIVDPDTTGRLSIYSDGKIYALGQIYYVDIEGRRMYTIVNVRTGTPTQDIDLVWSTPILAIYTQLDRLGIEIID